MSGLAMSSLWPKEHGAYGQFTFPLLTAFAVAGVSKGGLLLAAAVAAGFLAHEPGVVLLGRRGGRARRELRGRAVRWLACCLTTAAAAGIGAVLAIDPAARWSMALPLVLAFVLAIATVRGQDKSWPGEVTAALAFSGAALPVSLAAGASVATAAAIAIPFALLFSVSTLSVRVVVLRVRGGGDPRAASATRRAALSLAGGATAALVVATAGGQLSPSVLLAAIPGLLTASIVAAHPPGAAHLRAIGWSLVGASIVTAALVIATA